MTYPVDLHAHTTRSDGKDSPEELVRNAAAQGVRVLGLTDHDMVPPEEIAGEAAVGFARRLGVTLVPGYEFSCDTYIDDVHICGYGLNWSDVGVAAEVQAAKNSKSNAYRELCEILTRAGLTIDWETDILQYTDASGTIQRRLPDEVQRKHIFEAMAARGYAPSWSDAKLLVRDTPEFNNRRRKIDPFDAIALIHSAGGIAVLAHPYLIDERLAALGRPESRHEFILQLFEAGLDGIEACYTYDKTSYKGTGTPEEIEREVRARYADCVRFFSGGSDYHADHRKGTANARRLGERGLDQEEGEKFLDFYRQTHGGRLA